MELGAWGLETRVIVAFGEMLGVKLAFFGAWGGG
jgi:hypothetical protein